MDCGIEFFERAASLQMRPSRALPGSYIGFGERYGAGPVGGAGAHIAPTHLADTIHNIGHRCGCPMALVFSTDGADQFCVRIDQQAQRIGIERNVRAIFLAVARDALAELASFFGRLHADSEYLDFF